MGLFKLFTPKVDPLVSWRAEPGQTTDFDFDFDRYALCGIKLDDPASLIWKLGPSEDKPEEANGVYNFYSRGVEVDTEDGKVVGFVLYFNDERRKKYLPFQSPCRFRGQPVGLRAGTTEAEIKAIFGESYWRDEDEDEVILFYEFGNIECQFEINAANGLCATIVITPPLLAEEAVRNSYRVTKSWPPQVS